MLFFRRRKSTPYATRAADVYRFGPPANEKACAHPAACGEVCSCSETPLFDQAVYATGVLPEQPELRLDVIDSDTGEILVRDVARDEAVLIVARSVGRHTHTQPTLSRLLDELDLLALPIATGTLRGPSERA